MLDLKVLVVSLLLLNLSFSALVKHQILDLLRHEVNLINLAQTVVYDLTFSHLLPSGVLNNLIILHLFIVIVAVRLLLIGNSVFLFIMLDNGSLRDLSIEVLAAHLLRLLLYILLVISFIKHGCALDDLH